MQVDYYENFDLDNLVTPVNVQQLESLLKNSSYDAEKTAFLVDGFTNSFSIGYEGDPNVKFTAPNLRFWIENEKILWNKVMKEVKAKRYAGPFEKIPFDTFIQSPIGLVPKDNGRDYRLIFHLSYPHNSIKPRSVNTNTPASKCKVTYCDFDMAIKRCIEEKLQDEQNRHEVSLQESLHKIVALEIFGNEG